MFGDLTFDIQWGTFDFTDVYGENDTRTSRFLYHFGLMAQPTIVLLYLLRRIGWKQKHAFEVLFITTTFLYTLKDCWDVAYCNNDTGMVIYDISVFVIVNIGGYFCIKYSKDKRNGTTKE